MTAPRRLRVRHTTEYRYDSPVDRSTHQGRLRPVHHQRQSVQDHVLRVETSSGPVEVFDFEDAFGNAAFRFRVDEPYTRLTVSAESTVVLNDYDPFDLPLSDKRPVLPLNWMPRQRMALSHYLQSLELPDTQLQALFEYARSFARDNDDDLLETLFAINLELFRNYEYLPGTTTNETTPFETYTSRSGVCQDFAGLFITLARLLQLPARYLCGYVYTGNKSDQGASPSSRAPSDATHAWVQLYVPEVGWIVFDPTNGVLPRLDHVRVAVGRNWRDAAPLTVTLFGDGSTETLDVSVTVEIVD